VERPDTPCARALKVEGLLNARDLGGLRRHDGTLTPRGVFYRSENVDRITTGGWQRLKDEGIKTVVDLRQPGERQRDVGRRPEWLTTCHVDLDGLDNLEFWADFRDNGLIGTALYYLPHLRTLPERAGAAVSAIVNAAPGGVLFHCMGGRDRTGMIAMLLLMAVDAEPDEIVDDYLTTVRLGDVRAASEQRENAEAEIEALCNAHGTTTESAFRSALGGVDLGAFLADAGLSSSEVRALVTWRGSIPLDAAPG
jgi:protein tyrosine/serine phosphatase